MIDKILRFLRCPDDSAPLVLDGKILACSKCSREFQIIDDNFLSILPSKFPEWHLRSSEPPKALEMYRAEFEREFSLDRDTGGWGDLSKAAVGTQVFYENEQKEAAKRLALKSTDLVIDVSGASGSYSIALADQVRTIVNCDLHVPSLLVGHRRHKPNMISLRAPYLNLPFIDGTFDAVICVDTLARGRQHEINLLREIQRVLKAGGKAFVDFHNKKGFSGNPEICEYTRAEVEEMLIQSGVKEFSMHPFGYVPLRLVKCRSSYPFLDTLFRAFAPCKRHLVVITK